MHSFGNAIPSDHIVDAITRGTTTHLDELSFFAVFRLGLCSRVAKEPSLSRFPGFHTAPQLFPSPGPQLWLSECGRLKKRRTSKLSPLALPPPTNGSAVRLFNLAADIEFSGLKDSDGETLADEFSTPWLSLGPN